MNVPYLGTVITAVAVVAAFYLLLNNSSAVASIGNSSVSALGTIGKAAQGR